MTTTPAKQVLLPWEEEHYAVIVLEPLVYLCDVQRHLVCRPYSVPNLHRMAADLGIDRCWFHRRSKHPHYDIPKRRIAEITARCTLVHPFEILATITGVPRAV